MDSTILAAIIGGVFAILAAILTYWLTTRPARAKDALNAVEGYIFEPVPNQEVDRRIECKGLVKNVEPDLYLRLAVEVGGLIWPKEGAVNVNEGGEWDATIFEDGEPERFSVALYVMNAEGDKKVNDWLNEKDYRGMRRLYDARRIAAVDGLRLANKIG